MFVCALLLLLCFVTDSTFFLRVSLHSAHGVMEESCDRGVLSAGGVSIGGRGGVHFVLQIQER